MKENGQLRDLENVWALSALSCVVDKSQKSSYACVASTIRDIKEFLAIQNTEFLSQDYSETLFSLSSSAGLTHSRVDLIGCENKAGKNTPEIENYEFVCGVKKGSKISMLAGESDLGLLNELYRILNTPRFTISEDSAETTKVRLYAFKNIRCQDDREKKSFQCSVRRDVTKMEVTALLK